MFTKTYFTTDRLRLINIRTKKAIRRYTFSISNTSKLRRQDDNGKNPNSIRRISKRNIESHQYKFMRRVYVVLKKIIYH